MTVRRDEIRRLHRERPRNRFLGGSLVVLGVLASGAWVWAASGISDLVGAQRIVNLRRFLEHDAMPYPLRANGFTWGGFWEWARTMWESQGRAGAAATFWIAVIAILIAASAALPLSLLGARVLAAPDPFVGAGDGLSSERAWAGRRAFAWAVRGASVLLRAIPEYILAFLLLAVFGTSAWPAILALAVHNAGILGRLGAETVENLDRAPLRALRLVGARRAAVALFGALPMAFPRFLLYFFYRFESCVREATVLGMLGIASLGAFVQEARARQRYDEMLFLVLVGGVIVLLADLASQLTRAWIRRET